MTEELDLTPYKEHLYNRIVSMHAEGKSQREIAKEVKLNKTSIGRLTKKYDNGKLEVNSISDKLVKRYIEEHSDLKLDKDKKTPVIEEALQIEEISEFEEL